MIAPLAIVSTAATIALVILGIAFLLTAYRVVTGPTLPDRILALDMLTGIAIGFIAVIAVKTGFALYIDIAISLGLVAFLATVAFARFVLSRGGKIERRAENHTFAVKKPKATGKGKGKRGTRKGTR
jgi:multicomponent Na+:H+ antiporter subunit F